jgi:hypothetical protein
MISYMWYKRHNYDIIVIWYHRCYIIVLKIQYYRSDLWYHSTISYNYHDDIRLWYHSQNCDIIGYQGSRWTNHVNPDNLKRLIAFDCTPKSSEVPESCSFGHMNLKPWRGTMHFPATLKLTLASRLLLRGSSKGCLYNRGNTPKTAWAVCKYYMISSFVTRKKLHLNACLVKVRDGTVTVPVLRLTLCRFLYSWFPKTGFWNMFLSSWKCWFSNVSFWHSSKT